MNTPQTTRTPGPWRSTTPPSCLLTTRQIRTEHDELIADVGTPGEKGVGTIQNVANAHLIAASPDLLAALVELHEYTRTAYSGYRNALTQAEDELYLKVHTAINLATGQTP